MGEFMGDDRVEGGAEVDKEHPNISVLIFQVKEGNMESNSNGV